MSLPARFPVRPQDALVAAVLVQVMVQPHEEMPAGDLAKAAVEAVRNAVLHSEQDGHQFRPKDRVALGISEVVKLRNRSVVRGS